MVVRIDSARLEVEIDTRRAVGEVREIESQLERARTRRRRAVPRVDPGSPGRAAARRLGAAAAIGAAGAGARVAGAGGGLKRAVGLAAKVGVAVAAFEAIKEAPTLLPALVPQELLEREIIPGIVFKLLGFDREGLTVAEIIDGLQTAVAETEAAVISTMKSIVILNASLQEGKLVEAGFEGADAIQGAISAFLQGKPARQAQLPAFQDLKSVLTAHHSYQRAERIFRQQTKEAENIRIRDNLLRAVSAGGGGANR